MSYPHIDPKTYLRLQAQDTARPLECFGPPRIFAVGSLGAVICDVLRGMPVSVIKGIVATLRKNRFTKSDSVVSASINQS